MNFSAFLSDKILSVILILFAVITIEIFLLIYPIDIFIRIYIAVSIFLTYFIGLRLEYSKKQHYFKEIDFIIDELTDKYLFTEISEDADFYEGKQLQEILCKTNKAMIENVNNYKLRQKDYKEYIELWIHDIKIPIAAAKMIIENNKNSITQSIYEELDKVEALTEQALYYARSNTVEKDYIIKSCLLKNIVTESVKRNKAHLIRNQFKISLHDLNFTVKTDSKWVIFILNQIIQNSIKYRKENPSLTFYAQAGNEQTTLSICDNGIGIDSAELENIFDKGFTGTNGHLLNQKSTGIGLYLCKKLCHKLHIGISVSSQKHIGTEIKLIFPNGSFTDSVT